MQAKTIIRLDASPYQRESFFRREQEVAGLFGLTYLYADAQHRELSYPLPDGYGGPYILVSNTHTKFTELPQEILEQTELLIHANSGYDNFKGSGFQKWNFPVVLGNQVRAPAVVEYILGHLFERFAVHVHQANWSAGRHWNRPLLSEQSILIIGHGHIGQKLKDSLSPLVSSLSVFDPYLPNQSGKIIGHDYQEELRNHLKHKNIVLMACGLNGRNRHMIGMRELSLLAKDNLIINAARGALIKEEDLIAHLKGNPHAYAICDVFEKEPYQDQFSGLNNIHLTSHIAGVSQHLEDHMVRFLQHVLSDFSQATQKKGQGPSSFLTKYQDLLLKERLRDGVLI